MNPGVPDVQPVLYCDPTQMTTRLRQNAAESHFQNIFAILLEREIGRQFFYGSIF